MKTQDRQARNEYARGMGQQARMERHPDLGVTVSRRRELPAATCLVMGMLAITFLTGGTRGTSAVAVRATAPASPMTHVHHPVAGAAMRSRTPPIGDRNTGEAICGGVRAPIAERHTGDAILAVGCPDAALLGENTVVPSQTD